MQITAQKEIPAQKIKTLCAFFIVPVYRSCLRMKDCATEPCHSPVCGHSYFRGLGLAQAFKGRLLV